MPNESGTTISLPSSTGALLFPVEEARNPVEENDMDLLMARLICTQILMPIVSFVGIAVAVYDLLYSLTGLPLTLRTYASLEMSATYMNALTYILPLGNMWSNITTWLTCAFTIERFIAISTPIRSRKNSSIRRTRFNIVFVSLITALITLPDFFERKIHEAWRTCYHDLRQRTPPSGPEDKCVEVFYAFEPTWIGEQLDRFGWSYANVALFVFIPLIILAIFNALLIKSVIQAHHERDKMLANLAQLKFDRNVQLEPMERSEPIRSELVWRKWWITRQFERQHSSRENTTGPLKYSKSHKETHSTENASTTETTKGVCDTTSEVFTPVPCESQSRAKTRCCRCRKRNPHQKIDNSLLRLSSHQDKQSITIMLIAVVVVFCVLSAPSAVIHIIRTWFKPSDVRLKICGNVSNLLLMLNAAMNFFLYSLFSARFRHSFRMLLKRRRC
uniref:G_PROTEIN_RECEP_F1_2 domain-containing protein n=1 Tax=Mesocestoides corti TaxID=53468 RepID=A0A5K3F0A0_MESCO